MPSAIHPVLAAAVLLRWSLPREASAHGVALDRYLGLNLWIILALAAAAHLLLAVGLLRSRNPDDAAAGRRRNLRLEWLPLLLFTVLFSGLALAAEHLWAQNRYTGADPAALQVEVTGMQFAWYFRYPGPDGTFGRTDLARVDPGAGNPLGLDPADPHGEDDIVSSELVLPAGHEVSVTLRALDVIHGFALPELRVKQNAIPGEVQQLHFTPTVPGTYAVMCTQLCGLGHYRMNSNLRILPPPAFDTWLRTREQAQQTQPAEQAHPAEQVRPAARPPAGDKERQQP